MADVEMTDAPTSAVVPKKKGADSEAKEGKKRFEVKKVYIRLSPSYLVSSDNTLVECCRALGMGHCGRQLCHLQESHHGSL